MGVGAIGAVLAEVASGSTMESGPINAVTADRLAFSHVSSSAGPPSSVPPSRVDKHAGHGGPPLLRGPLAGPKGLNMAAGWRGRPMTYIMRRIEVQPDSC